MRFYTSVIQYGNRLLVRGVNRGKTVQDRLEFRPTLWVPSKKPNTTHRSLMGVPLESIQFESINEAKDYIKRYDGVENFAIYGNTNFAYQYITESFPGEIEFEMSQIRILSLDIETTAEYGFPDVRNPAESILLITMQDYATKEIVTFGARHADPIKTNHKYITCKDEYDLLKRFLEYWSANYPHVITGWNIEFFDMPYLVNRIKRVLGEDSCSNLKAKQSLNFVVELDISILESRRTLSSAPGPRALLS